MMNLVIEGSGLSAQSSLQAQVEDKVRNLALTPKGRGGDSRLLYFYLRRNKDLVLTQLLSEEERKRVEELFLCPNEDTGVPLTPSKNSIPPEFRLLLSHRHEYHIRHQSCVSCWTECLELVVEEKFQKISQSH